MMDVMFVIVMLLPMILAGVFKMWTLFIVFTTFNVIFGITEVVSKKITGKTVSQNFWAFKTTHPVKALLICISMAIMWSCLILHLMVH